MLKEVEVYNPLLLLLDRIELYETIDKEILFNNNVN